MPLLLNDEQNTEVEPTVKLQLAYFVQSSVALSTFIKGKNKIIAEMQIQKDKSTGKYHLRMWVMERDSTTYHDFEL